DLQLVLDVAQEAVGAGERRGLLGAHVAARGELAERGERAPLLEAGILAAVHELLRLDDELDLANAAAAELDVARAGARVAQRRVHTPLHHLEVLDRGKVQVAAVDEAEELVEQRLAERPVAGDRPRLQPGRALPRLPEGLVVGERRGERDGERPLAAARAQPEVHPEAEPLGRHVAQRAGPLRRQAREELPVRPPPRVGTVALVDVDQVDVGAVVELAAPELPHAEDDEAPGPIARPVLAPLGREPRARASDRRLDAATGVRRYLANGTYS